MRSLILFLDLLFFLTSITAAGFIESIQTDKARYNPGDEIIFTIQINNTATNWNLNVKYRYLLETIKTHSIPVTSANFTWTWRAPADDFKGYLVEINLISDSTDLDRTNIAVDVSSEWSKFPRYGFLSKYPLLSPEEIESTISRLNRFHINGLQFYDWHYKHHLPLSGTPDNPAPSWPDIANRINYFSTINSYIQTAHKYHMETMSYNLLYGALENAAQDGVSEDWCLFKDAVQGQKDVVDLSFWGHYIFIMDPNNHEWKTYIFSEMQKVFQALDFDGWHIDQLGDRGDRWNALGQPVILEDAFHNYITDAGSILDVPLVMNAVNQYGQEFIAQSPVKFLYSEVWYPNTTFEHLARIITDNQNNSQHSLNSVLAAYINHDLAENPGWFNTPAVLMADAVIFAFGGAHLELGEHMLAHEYFPNDNLRMSTELQQNLIYYYDFLVAYQNLLRDGGNDSNIDLTTSGSIAINIWPPVSGNITTMGRKVDSRQVLHLFNFVNASTLDWRDNEGTQREPNMIERLALSFTSQDSIRHIWTASPDIMNGSPMALSFTQINETVLFTLPQLKYWQMVVIEYESDESSSSDANNPCHGFFALHENYPNPVKHSTTIDYALYEPAHLVLTVSDVLGRKIITLVDSFQESGNFTVNFSPANLSSGIYFYTLQTSQCIQTKKMLLIH